MFPHPFGARSSSGLRREHREGVDFTNKPPRFSPKRTGGVCLGLEISEGNSSFGLLGAEEQVQVLGKAVTPELRWGAAGTGCRQGCGPFPLAPALAAVQGLNSWKELSCFLPAQT